MMINDISVNDSKIHIQTSRLVLRTFTPEDITQNYIDWLNDPETNRYLECKYKIQDMDSLTQWVEAANQDPTRVLLGIFHEDLHIGNVTFYSMDSIHKCLRASIAVGRKSARGSRFSTEAFGAAIEYAFNYLQYNRVESGIYDGNIAAIKMCERVGFHIESRQKQRIFFEGKFIDMFLLVVIKSDFLKLQKNK